MHEPAELNWNIHSVEQETERIKNLYLTTNDQRPDFIAGQYLTVKLPGLGPSEGKAYSISSAPHEKYIRLSIKQIGRFSEALLGHQPGDTLTTSLPYGFFYPEADDHMPLVFVAGGIGITPCLSIIKDLLYKGDERSLVLHYSNQTIADTVFLAELAELKERYSNFQLYQYITREEIADERFVPRRMQTQTVLRDIQHDSDTLCFICGAMNFTKEVWNELNQAGIPHHQLYTEGFF